MTQIIKIVTVVGQTILAFIIKHKALFLGSLCGLIIGIILKYSLGTILQLFVDIFLAEPGATAPKKALFKDSVSPFSKEKLAEKHNAECDFARDSAKKNNLTFNDLERRATLIKDDPTASFKMYKIIQCLKEKPEEFDENLIKKNKEKNKR